MCPKMPARGTEQMQRKRHREEEEEEEREKEMTKVARGMKEIANEALVVTTNTSDTEP